MRPGKGLPALFFLSLLLLQSATAQVMLISSSPADGSVNVALTGPLRLTFSAALDTSVSFAGTGAFLAYEVFPEPRNARFKPPEVTSDLRSVALPWGQLTPQARYVFVLRQAHSITGETLLRPYVLTFSTGQSLPSGQITGKVSDLPLERENIIVGLLRTHESRLTLAAAGVSNGEFHLQHLEPGVFWPVAVRQSEGARLFELGSDDALGFVDADHDGYPDSLTIRESEQIANVDIRLRPVVARTAVLDAARVNAVAQTWSKDAALVAIESSELSEDGRAFTWIYVYHSAARGIRTFFSHAGAIFPVDFVTDVPVRVGSLPESWVDSDSAAFVAESGGGADFRSLHARIETFVSLNTMTTAREGNVNFFGGFPQVSRQVRLQAQNEAAQGTGDRPIWFFFYYTPKPFTSWDIGIDALTGEVLFSSNKILTGIAEQGKTHSFSLSQNYPNPFNPNTLIAYSLPDPARVRLTVYNLLGQKVRTLVRRHQAAGNHEVVWDGKNDSGVNLESGVFFYRLQIGGGSRTRRMILLR